VQCDDLAAMIDEHKKIAVCDLRNVFRCVLDRDRVGTAHNGASDGKVRQQSHVTGQHGFALVPEILEGGYRIAQIHGDAPPDIVANAALHEQQARGGEAGRNEQH